MGNSPDSPSDSATPHSERRKTPRYNFVASTELTDVENATKLSGRITELSRSGCYVDTLNVLPVGTLLRMQISCDQGTLLVKGKIVFVQERIGMGVVFLDLGKDQMEILDSWLADLPPAAER